MYTRIVIGLAAIALVYLLLRWFVRTPPATIKRHLLTAGIAAVIGVLVILAATGRLHWLYALGASLLPLLRRLLPLLRYVPLLRGLVSKVQAARNGGATQAGQQSRVSSRFLRMTLDHDTGELNGEVIAGPRQGQRLGELSLPQLLELLKHYRIEDGDSANLLEAYLDRVHGADWREAFAGDGEEPYASATDSGTMTPDEAYRILGLDAGADRDAIIAAHRRLMQKLHPDRGGSTYLAAKINQAKECLLGQ